jgi:conjugal transfer mating pair stabilization protein TraG
MGQGYGLACHMATLFAVLNALGYMYAAKSTTAHLIGYGEGLNLMTQNGLADSAYTAYCFVMGLQYSVPFVSWALISSGGGYALSQLSSFLTQSGESFAAKASSEVVDGNVSFDSQTLHHRSVANTQLAQQQVGPSFNYGSRFDDGKLATLYGPGGQATFQEHQTQMGTNVSQNDALSAMFAVQGQMALNSSLSESKSAGTQSQMGINETVSLMNNLSNSKGFTETFGESGSSNIQKSFSDTMDLVRQFAKDHHVSDSSAFTALMSAGLKVNPEMLSKSGGLGQIVAGLHGEIGGNFQTSAQQGETLSNLIKTGKAQQFATNFSQSLNYLEDNKGSISDSFTRQKMNQIQDHFNKANTYSEQAGASLQQSRTWSETASQQRQKGISASSNLNEVALRRKADRDFGGDIGAAAQWATQNPVIYQKEVSHYLDSNQSSMSPKGMSSKEDVYQHNEETKRQVDDAPSDNSRVEQTRINSNKEFIALEEKLDQHRNKTQQTRTWINKTASVNQGIEHEYDSKDKEFMEESNKWNVTRAAGRLFK